MADAKTATETKKAYNGVYRASVLCTIDDYDFIEGTAVDYQHGSCLGVGKYHTNLWFDPSYSSRPWSVRAHIAEVDKELKEMQVPSAVSRCPRSLSEHRKFWKASEYRSWILYYSVPILRGKLKEPYFSHWCCFVLGLMLLLLPSISPANLKLAGILLTFFYEQHTPLQRKVFFR